MKKKQVDGEIGAGQTKANFCRTSAAEPARAMFSHWRGGADGYFCNESERADSIIHRRMAVHSLYLGWHVPGDPFGARSRGKEEGRCHKHGNQSDRRREVRIKEQQEERSPGFSSLIFLLSRTSQSSPLQ